MKKNIDNKTGFAVACGHLLNTGMYGPALVSIAVFLRPASEGMLGWVGNILNTCRSLTYAVFNIPALVLNSFEQEYVIMKTATVEGFYAHIAPESLLWDCKSRLEFLTLLIQEEPDLIKHDRAFSGFAAVLCDAESLLGLAIGKLQKEGAI